jgi:predicted alpha/beta hydrolase family esterase
MPNTPILILPGLSSSGPDHWQTLWERKHPEYVRVEQQDWFDPSPSNWVRNIESSVATCSEPPILVAHSLATIAVTYWAQSTLLPIRGAFLVAPADVESPNPHSELLKAFCPVPLKKMPFPSLIVASTNDPYASLERVKQFAQCWGSQILVVGALGHINTASGLGEWAPGHKILIDWVAQLPEMRT